MNDPVNVLKTYCRLCAGLPPPALFTISHGNRYSHLEGARNAQAHRLLVSMICFVDAKLLIENADHFPDHFKGEGNGATDEVPIVERPQQA